MVCIHLTNPFVIKMWWRWGDEVEKKTNVRHIKWIKTMTVCRRRKKSDCRCVLSNSRTVGRRKQKATESQTAHSSFIFRHINRLLIKENSPRYVAFYRDKINWLHLEYGYCVYVTHTTYNMHVSPMSVKEYFGIAAQKNMGERKRTSCDVMKMNWISSTFLLLLFLSCWSDRSQNGV